MYEVFDVSKDYITKKRVGLFRYKKEVKKAIKNAHLSIPRGKIIGVLGENGAGKTTLIKMMTTLLSSDTGKILIAGVDINKNVKNTRKRINIISGGEKNLYWRLTAVENLIYFASLYGISKKEALPKINELLTELGLWESKDIPVEKFSKGMKQRLQIAKGLINDPEYLFLDEPTLGLDVSIAYELRKKLREIAVERNTGILLTTHYMAEAEELCDYIYFLKHGEIIVSGTKSQVFEQLQMVPELHVILSEKYQKKSPQIPKISSLFPSAILEQFGNSMLLKFSLLEYNVKDIIKILYDNQVDIKEIKYNEPTLENAILNLGGKDMK
ncbi:ABC transporter ATP-binding protein [Streptococcus intermedius]|uniref:ABC transporter ATP-binding protein n=1 Tax=Streptococcus intermedius TaxID=1338 RepID=UPI000F6625E3|nr:ABC transporter ATP-binding protein [Streptococcus intermedius]RSJ16648.1 Daunorubicin/doxorubicin resistance ATP-binding protein DrrA [Streptococcus intermedius]